MADEFEYERITQQEEEVVLPVAQDYWQTINPAGIQFYNPETRFDVQKDAKQASLDIDDPRFKAAWDVADGETKEEMIKATSVEHALVIVDRRKLYEGSARSIQEDSLPEQFLYGAIPAVASPSSLIPIAGTTAKLVQVGKAANRIAAAGKVAVVGGVTAATANVIDESLLASQGIQHDYYNATFYGLAFGGMLGGVSGFLSGPSAKQVSDNIIHSKDSYTSDFTKDPNIKIEYDENGVPRTLMDVPDIPQMSKSIIDRIPLIGGWLRSDVHTVYQGDSPTIRGLMARVISPTVSLTDANGNIVAIGKNGHDFKRSLRGNYNNLTNGMDALYVSAKEQGYKGSRNDLFKEVSSEYTRVANAQEADAYKTIKFDKDENAFRANLQKFYDDYEPAFRGPDYVKQGVELYRDYYNKMLKSGQDIGIKELGKLGTGKYHRPRVYNFKAIHDGHISKQEVKDNVYAALAFHPSNRAKYSDEQIRGLSDEISDSFITHAFSNNYSNVSYLTPSTELPFQTMLKSRQLMLDETKLGKLLDDNLDEVTSMYHYKMSGRQALQYAFGTDNIGEVMSVAEKMIIKNEGKVNVQEQLAAFNRVVEDLTGTLRINTLSNTPAWTFTRNLATYNSGRLGGGFGGNQFIEMAAATMLSGIDNIISSGRFSKSFQSAGKLLYTADKKPHDDFTEFLVGSGFMSDVLHTNRVNRYADTEAGFNSGTLEKSLNWANDKLMKWNGMRYFMGAMEDMTGGAVLVQLQKFASQKTLSKTELQRLARWGLTEADARTIGKELQNVYDPANGRLDLHKMSGENIEKFQLAVTRGIEETVIQGDSLHLPNWMKAPNAVVKLMTQFMRFPMIAQETLLRRGMNEEQARLAAAAVSSTITFMGLKYIREQAAIEAGFMSELDAQYDYFDSLDGDEAIKRGVLGSLNYNAPLGMMTDLWNKTATISGMPELGRDYATNKELEAFLGPSFGGLAPDAIEIIQATLNGDLGDETTLNKAKSMMLWNNYPIVHEGLKALTDEFGK